METNKTELQKRAKEGYSLARHCELCPRRCGVNRLEGETGFCNTGLPAKVYSYRQYLGEEPPISGHKGSGVIFFSHCTMRCAYCQNFRFSQNGTGYAADAQALHKIMASLTKRACHNINLVTATQYLPVVLEALSLAVDELRDTPIVYNTSGYESKNTLELLRGVVDIYLADMRYSDDNLSKLYSMTSDYVKVNREAISIMYKQVGELVVDEKGVAKRGLIIRHLVLPNQTKNTDGVLKYIASNLSKNIHISLMAQYIPMYKAGDFPEINRVLMRDEYETARKLLERYGLDCGWTQELQK